MDGELNIDRQIQYVARISHGKDSLKMLDVIFTRGLPIDRITSTDVWATDTIRGEHPEMVKFKERADEYIWQKYRIEVEHLCAMRDGEKVTYEKLFYHIPKRKPKKCGGGIVRNKGQSSDSRRFGGRGANPTSRGARAGRPQGFPAQVGSWCKKLKIDYIRIPGQCQPERELVYQAQDQIFTRPRREGRYKYRGIPWHSSRRTETVWAAYRQEARRLLNLELRRGFAAYIASTRAYSRPATRQAAGTAAGCATIRE